MKLNFRGRYFIFLLWLVISAALFWGLHKIARDRPHLLGTSKTIVEEIIFSEDGMDVCGAWTNPDPSYAVEELDCWNKDTRGKTRPIKPRRQSYGTIHLFRDEFKNSYYRLGGNLASKDIIENYALVSFSMDGHCLTMAKRDGVSQWRLPEGKLLWRTPLEQLRTENYLNITALSPDGSMCVVQGKNQDGKNPSKVMDCRSGKIIVRILNDDSIGFTPDSRLFWTSNRYGISFFNVHTSKFVWHTRHIPNLWIPEPRFTPDELMGFATFDGFDLLNSRTGKLKRHFNSPTVNQLETWNFSPDGKQLWWSTPQHQIFWRDLS